MNNSRELTFGYFLDIEMWRTGLKLLDFQIKQKEKNRHYNTLTMHYYEKVKKSIKKKLYEDEYYLNRISNNLFYGLANEFFVYQYLKPKNSLGVRKYYIFSYPMRALHYSIGLYLLNLSQEFINENINSNDKISSYYGANLTYQSNKLIMTKKNIYYKEYYKSFKRNVKNLMNTDADKLIITIDIENYFENISISNLLTLLKENVKPSTAKKIKFNDNTISQIVTYYEFISNNRGGIPQSDHDIISDFLGYLYLSFGDLIIEDEIKELSDIVSDYKIVRYVDDIVISLEFNDELDYETRKSHTIYLISRIADIFYYRLGLRLNEHKTKIFNLNNEEEKLKLYKRLKKVSVQSSPSSVLELEKGKNKDKKSLQETLNNMFSELEKLKKYNFSRDVESIQDIVDGEILKEIYDEKIIQIIKKRENQKKLIEVFEDFNYDLIKFKPKEITLIVLKNETLRDELINFIIKKKKWSTVDRAIATEILCQMDFKIDKLTKRIKKDKYSKYIIDIIEYENTDINVPGYYDLPFEKIRKICNDYSIIDQIRRRIMNEKSGNLSIALNHLVNEFQSICYLMDENNCSVDKKDYNVNSVIKFLKRKFISNSKILQIRNMFDSRNNNLVSHSGSDEILGWDTTKDEYDRYKNAVQDCLEKIF